MLFQDDSFVIDQSVYQLLPFCECAVECGGAGVTSSGVCFSARASERAMRRSAQLPDRQSQRYNSSGERRQPVL